MIREFILVAFYFTSSRIIFLFFAYFAQYIIPLREGYLGSQFDGNLPYIAWIWANFDGRHYLNIANSGYQNTDFAFFPLYPLLISIAGYVLPISHIYLGILISTIAMVASMYVIYKIVLLDYKKEVGTLTLFVL